MSSSGYVSVVSTAQAGAAGIGDALAALAKTVAELLEWERQGRERLRGLYQEAVGRLGRPGAPRAALEAVARLEARWSRFQDQHSPYRELLAAVAPTRLDRLEGDRRRVLSLWQQARWEEAAQAAQELKKALDQEIERVRRELPARQAEALAGLAARALRDLGYQVERPDPQNPWLLHGARGPYRIAVAVRVPRRGRPGFAFDMAGFAGAECLTELRRLEEALTRYGLGLEVRPHFHGRPEGGPLISPSAAEAPRRPLILYEQIRQGR